jgi:pimeloyl-ACP methyl ester carboxylesterase
MKRCARVFAGVVVLVALLVTSTPAQAQLPPPGCGVPFPLPSGALALICVPETWNGQLVVYAPGYTPPQLPLGFYQLSTPDGASLPLLVQSLGYAFATTSYRKNGLAILEGADDVRALVAAFPVATGRTPSRTHITGVSEGGLVATLLAERSPELFSSALAACAPIGSFRQQVNYVGDFRALFDYYFPGVLPGSPVDMPAAAGLIFDVAPDGVIPYKDRIAAALVANPAKALELMRVARVAYDPANLATVITSAVNLLRYNVVGTIDSQLVLGGNPYGNRTRWYFGSSNDLRLNLLVRRYSAAPAALAALAGYETDGDLSIPLVTIHTTADDVAPFAHELLYLPKVDLVGRGRFVPFPVFRYGHCNFTATEVGLSLQFTVSLP